jgi:hypothetical protein
VTPRRSFFAETVGTGLPVASPDQEDHMHPKYAPAYLHWYRSLQQQRWAEQVPAYRAIYEREQARRNATNDNLLRAEPPDLLPEIPGTEIVGNPELAASNK